MMHRKEVRTAGKDLGTINLGLLVKSMKRNEIAR
jgi:hypothetical protein